MIGSTRRVSVRVHRMPTDMRKSFDTLSALVRECLGSDVLAGDLFLFVGRDQKRAKVIFFDGTGLCIFAKRLSKGTFVAPWEMKHAEMTQAELSLFLEGSKLIGRAPLSPATVAPDEMFLGPDAFS